MIERSPETETRTSPEARDADEIVGLPVIATNEGREIGRVKDVLFDPDEQALLGVMVSPSDSADDVMFLNRSHIRGLGNDAVTVESASALTHISMEARAKEIRDSGVHLKGANMLTEDGNALGTVDKIMIDGDCRITAYRARSGLLGLGGKNEIEASDVVKLGTDALIVRGSTAPGRLAAAPDLTPAPD